MIEGYAVYSIYTGLKNHLFNRGYDYYKYHKKINVNKSSFENRNDKSFFYVLANKFYSCESAEMFFIGNFKERGNIHISQLCNEYSYHHYFSEYSKIIDQIGYYIQQDLDYIKSKMNVNDKYITGGEIFKDYVGKKITLETLSYFNLLYEIYDLYENKGSLLYDNIKIFLRKYCIVLEHLSNKEEIKKIFKKTF